MTTEPSNSDNQGASDPGPVLTLIRQIKENRLDPALLSTEDRQRCVDVLWSEGYSVPEIAQILQRGERTVYRDRSDLRAAHALRVHPQLAPQMAGELIRQAECSISRLRRIARESGASAMERSMAENLAFKTFVEMIGKLQSLGFLPRVPTGVVAQVVGTSAEAIATCDQLEQRLADLERIDRESGATDPEVTEERQLLTAWVRRARLAAEVEQARGPSPSKN